MVLELKIDTINIVKQNCRIMETLPQCKTVRINKKKSLLSNPQNPTLLVAIFCCDLSLIWPYAYLTIVPVYCT